MAAGTRDALKSLARGLAFVAVVPALLSYFVRSAFVGPSRALESSSEMLGLVPGLLGQYLRRAFLSRVIAHCAPSAVIGFGTLLSQAGARIDENVYIGPRCHLGLVHLEENVLLAAGVHVPSGPNTHGTDPSLPIRDQPGRLQTVRIGAGSWIGSNCVVLADVGRNSIVAAGAVVTGKLPDDVVAAGVPARIVRHREACDTPA
jgi:acetyltransferase-like isoleucine patch superfamily enzyme